MKININFFLRLRLYGDFGRGLFVAIPRKYGQTSGSHDVLEQFYAEPFWFHECTSGWPQSYHLQIDSLCLSAKRVQQGSFWEFTRELLGTVSNGTYFVSEPVWVRVAALFGAVPLAPIYT